MLMAGIFQAHAIVVENHAVLLGHVVEGPAKVGCVGVEPEAFLHPVAAPDARIEVGHQAEGLACDLGEARAVGVVRHHLGLAGHVGLELEVHAVEERPLGEVGHAPFEEVAALELAHVGLAGVVRLPIGHAGAQAQLDLPAGEVCVQQEVGVGADDGGADAVDHGEPRRRQDVGPGPSHAIGVEELVHRVVGEDAKHAVVGDRVGDARLHTRGVPCVVVGKEGSFGAKRFHEALPDLVHVGPRIAFDGEGEPAASLARELVQPASDGGEDGGPAADAPFGVVDPDLGT